MILIGQYDSPFVRRVGIALRMHGLAFEHRPWSVFGDADRLMALNPLGSVPVLVLADGTVLADSKLILDAVDDLAPAGQRLWPPAAEMAAARAVTALSTGLSDRVVSLFYERHMHAGPASALAIRREAQVRATLAALEEWRSNDCTTWLFGESLTHADIALACALRHLRDSMPTLFDTARLPSLVAHAAQAEALPVFAEISQPFDAPV